MDKISLNSFTILYICLSQKWSSIERRALFDATFLRNCGGNPVILCYKNTQIDREAEIEAIPRIYITRENLKFNRILSYVSQMQKILAENRFEIVHCYHLTEYWLNAYLMRRHSHLSLIFTFNQNTQGSYHSFMAKWFLKRVDNILTLSAEVKELVCESFAVSSLKVKNIGFGLDLVRIQRKESEIMEVGCVVNNLGELQRLRMVVRVFSYIKSHDPELAKRLKFSIYLGPRVFNKRNAKNLLTELDHAFYEADIMIYGLEERSTQLKEISLLIGVAFEEPLNDFEMKAIIHKIPVLFPRTAARQSLLFRYEGIGESYLDGDIREITVKLKKIIGNYPRYTEALEMHGSEFYRVHGIDAYAQGLKTVYEGSFAKRQRYLAKKSFLSRKT